MLHLQAMHILPFHSHLPGIGLRIAWHDNNECPVAKSIASVNRVSGIGHLDNEEDYCRYCAMLERLSDYPRLKKMVERFI